MAGTPKGMQTSNLYQRMMNDPLYQQRVQDAQKIEGRDNRAVSNVERTIGADMGAEQKRTLGLDRFADELSRRKDDLAFKKRTAEYEREQFGIALENRKAAANFRNKQAGDQYDLEFGQMGLEFGLGLASLGVEAWRSKEERANREERKKEYEFLGLMYSQDSSSKVRSTLYNSDHINDYEY